LKSETERILDLGARRAEPIGSGTPVEEMNPLHTRTHVRLQRTEAVEAVLQRQHRRKDPRIGNLTETRDGRFASMDCLETQHNNSSAMFLEMKYVSVSAGIT